MAQTEPTVQLRQAVPPKPIVQITLTTTGAPSQVGPAEAREGESWTSTLRSYVILQKSPEK